MCRNQDEAMAAVLPWMRRSTGKNLVLWLDGGACVGLGACGDGVEDPVAYRIADLPAGAHLLADRDVVLFDQRGTGYSQPSLACPELRELELDLLDDGGLGDLRVGGAGGGHGVFLPVLPAFGEYEDHDPGWASPFDVRTSQRDNSAKPQVRGWCQPQAEVSGSSPGIYRPVKPCPRGRLVPNS